MEHSDALPGGMPVEDIHIIGGDEAVKGLAIKYGSTLIKSDGGGTISVGGINGAIPILIESPSVSGKANKGPCVETEHCMM